MNEDAFRKLDDYINRVKEDFQNSAEGVRFLILNDLESLLKRVDSILEQEVSGFNREIARKLREELGLSTRELGAMIGCPNSTITRIEIGETKVKYPHRSRNVMRYLHFLKEKTGYNPYNI